MEDSDLLIQAGFSTAKMEAETRKVVAKYEEAAKRSAKKFDQAMAKVSNSETLKATGREIERLARKYDPAYAAAKKYKRGVEELNRTFALGLIDNKKYEQRLESLVRDLERGGREAGKFGKAVNQNRGYARSYGNMMQNVGWQVGDFATQVGAGTSASQALGQQLPQLLGGFGALGAVSGAAAAILVPLASALYKNLTGAVDLEEQTKALTETTDAYVAAAEAATTPIETLREKYGGLAEEIAAVNKQAAIFAQAGAEVQVQSSLGGFAQGLGGFSRERLVQGDGTWDEETNSYRDDLSERQRDVLSLKEEFGLTREEAEHLASAIMSVRNAADLSAERQVTALKTVQEQFASILEANPDALDKLKPYLDQSTTLIESISKVVEASLSEDERRVEQLFNTYSERTREMARLAKDRALAENELHEAQAEGNLDRIESARQVVAGIDAEIDSLTDAKGRIDDLSAEAEILVRVMERLAFDPNNEMLKQARDFDAAVQQAEANLGELDEADLSGLEARLRLLREVIDDVRKSVLGVDGDLSVAAQNAHAQYGQSRIAGANMHRADVSSNAIDLIKQFEVFSASAYNDPRTDRDGNQVGPNVYRAGFGSDTVTLADGSVRRVTQGMQVSYEDANRDLLRRVGEFQDGIISQIGRDRWDGFTAQQQGMLTSTAYNYGSLPDRILPAVKSGTNQDIATALARLQSDNGGVNRSRRLKEGSAFGDTSLVQSEIQQESERQRLLKREVKERERLLEIRTNYAALIRSQVSDAELESSLIGKSAREQARLRAEYLLTQEAKRRGIDLNQKIAGSEETYAEAIKRTAEAVADQAVQQEELKARQKEAENSTRAMERAQVSLKQGMLDAIVEGKSL